MKWNELLQERGERIRPKLDEEEEMAKREEQVLTRRLQWKKLSAPVPSSVVGARGHNDKAFGQC